MLYSCLDNKVEKTSKIIIIFSYLFRLIKPESPCFSINKKHLHLLIMKQTKDKFLEINNEQGLSKAIVNM
jgi:hypothetical protein